MDFVQSVKRHYFLALPATVALHLYRAIGPRRPFSPDADYEAYFSALSYPTLDRVSSYRLKRYRAIAAIMKRFGGGSVLDVAVGDGTLLHYLKKNVDGIGKIWAADISKQAVEKATREGFSAFECDLLSLDERRIEKETGAKNGIDWIVATEVLEHVAEAEAVISRLARVAKKGVLVSVPNSGYFPFRLQLLMGRFPVQWDLWPGEHLRFWTYTDFRWWLRGLGLQGKPTVYFGMPGLAQLWKNLFADGILWHLTPKESPRQA